MQYPFNQESRMPLRLLAAGFGADRPLVSVYGMRSESAMKHQTCRSQADVIMRTSKRHPWIMLLQQFWTL